MWKTSYCGTFLGSSDFTIQRFHCTNLHVLLSVYVVRKDVLKISLKISIAFLYKKHLYEKESTVSFIKETESSTE